MRRGYRSFQREGAGRVRVKPSILTLLGAVASALVLQACASAPLNLGPQPEAAAAIAVQTELRSAASHLVETAEEKGWRVQEQRDGGAFALLGRLVSGGDDAAREDAPSPVDIYLETHGSEAGEALLGDITLAHTLAGEVTGAARRLVVTPEELDEDALDRDIAEIETAIAAARRAKSFFNTVDRRIEAQIAPARARAIETALSRFEDDVEAMAAAADALADRRWAFAHGEIG